MLVAIDDRAKLLTQTDLVKYISEHDKQNPIMKEKIADVASKNGWRVAKEVLDLLIILSNCRL